MFWGDVWARRCHRAGTSLTTRYSEVPADEELAALFGAEPEAPMLRRHFVFYARGEPEQISIN